MLEEEDLCVGRVYSCQMYCGLYAVLKYIGNRTFEFVNKNQYPKIFCNRVSLLGDVRFVCDRVEL
jgi:hypothetical protein